jgi:REP element-mobilizing transposase RayT
MGCCALKHPLVATVMMETLEKYDPERYRLIAWCIMPNHVHVLIEPRTSLPKIVQSWKSYTGRWGMERNAELGLGVPGKAFWMRDYWDRYIRDESHFQRVVDYIHWNPVNAGLCREPHDWPWSNAHAESPPSNSCG